MQTVTISKNKVRQEGGVVILPVEVYNELLERSVPTNQLRGKDAEEADRLVKEALRDYRAGKTRKLHSLADLD
jgi:predicted ATP-grasp superfamily ATP-dependent carboligase